VVAPCRRFGTTYLSYLQGASSPKTTCPLKMGPIVCPEKSARNYNSLLRKITKQRRFYLRRGGSMKSRKYQAYHAITNSSASETGRLRLKCDGTRAETRFSLSAKQTSPFKSAGVSVQWNTGSRGVRISNSNAEYTMFCGSVKSTGYPLYSPVSPSLPLPCVTVCHHIATAEQPLSRFILTAGSSHKSRA